MGLLIHLEVAERLGLTAATAALTWRSRAAGTLRSPQPSWPGPAGAGFGCSSPPTRTPASWPGCARLGSDVVHCPREPGEAGDPAYLRLREELAAGAVPFTCQGNENGLAIEGGETIAYEIASDLAGTGLRPHRHPGRRRCPGQRVRPGPAGGRRARRDRPRAPAAHRPDHRRPPARTRLRPGPRHAARRGGAGVGADAGLISRADVERVLTAAAQHRSAYMWPWESEPKSIATGILDDETYDWRAVVGAMLTTGGQPLVVTEDRLAEANELGRRDRHPGRPDRVGRPGWPARPAAGRSGRRGRARRRAVHRGAPWLRQRPASGRAGDRQGLR